MTFSVGEGVVTNEGPQTGWLLPLYDHDEDDGFDVHHCDYGALDYCFPLLNCKSGKFNANISDLTCTVIN